MTPNQPENTAKLSLNLSALNLAGVKSYGPSEVASLRKAGKLEEAYEKGRIQLEAEPSNIWARRDMGWVLYSYLKANLSPEKLNVFHNYVKELAALGLPEDEKMLFDQVGWQVGKMVFALLKGEHPDVAKIALLFEDCKSFSFTKPSEAYSFLFKAFHKALKEHSQYTTFADWWGLENFRDEDYRKEKLPNGKEVMSVVEQAYIAYAKQLLPRQTQFGETIFDREKVLSFMPLLDKITETHPGYQYPGYFKARLLLALGDQENLLSAILPFAKKKRNDFWVWDVLSEAFPQEEEKRVACYCRALSCKTPDEFLINLRQKMAKWFVGQGMYPEAKTEIELAMKAREANGWKVPGEVAGWISQAWFKEAAAKKSNEDFYKKYLTIADNILYTDIPEETVIVDFVNTDKKIANFIASDKKFGFFKFDRLISHLRVGDILKVRFNGGGSNGHFQLYTLEKTVDEKFQGQYVKPFEGVVRIGEGKPFGFVEDYFVHPNLVKRYRLVNQQKVKGKAIRSYNAEKGQWGWKVFEVETLA